MRWVAYLLGLLIATQVIAATPSILNAGTHADIYIAPAVTAVLGSNPFQIDYDPVGTIPSAVNNSSNASYAFTSVLTGTTPVNHMTYSVINASLCQYSPTLDVTYYATLEGQNSLLTIPLGGESSGSCGFLPAGSAPGTLLSAVTSTNSGNGTTGWGIEFGLSANYKGLNTSEDSWDSAATAGFYASMLQQHPAWNLFDVKAAFRQTASQWATGYSSTAYGYGILDYDSATGLSSTSALYLQPPGLSVQKGSFYLVATLLPFRQTRRAHEVIYSVSSSYVWPVKNEYTTADITASAATLLYTSNGTDVEPVFLYQPIASGTFTLVAFTTDGLGNYSRVEAFSEQTYTLTLGTMCTS